MNLNQRNRLLMTARQTTQPPLALAAPVGVSAPATQQSTSQHPATQQAKPPVYNAGGGKMNYYDDGYSFTKFLKFFRHWFPMVYTNPWHQAEKIAGGYSAYYRAVKILACYMRAMHEWQIKLGSLERVNANWSEDGLTRLFCENHRTLAILAGYPEKCYTRMSLPIEDTAGLSIESVMSMFGWVAEYVPERITETTQSGGRFTTTPEHAGMYKITDQYGSVIMHCYNEQNIRWRLSNSNYLTP